MPKQKLSTTNRKYLQFGVILILIIFLSFWFFYPNRPNTSEPTPNQEAYIQDSTLHIFGDTHDLNAYPNRIAMHYPYLLMIKPAEQTTIIYNLEGKRKHTQIPEAILDYDGTNILKNQGDTTYLNNHDLNTLCEKGFIKNPTEVICLTKVNTDTVENKLINITLPKNTQQDIYVSQNLITDFTYINGQTYIGEHELYTKVNYIRIDDKSVNSELVINNIYYDGKNISVLGKTNDDFQLYHLKELTLIKSFNGRLNLFTDE